VNFIGEKNVEDSAIGNGKVLVYRTASDELGYEVQAGGGGADEKVKISSNDTTNDFLLNKVVSDDLTLSEVGDGGDEDLKVNHGSTLLCTHTHLESDITDLDHTDTDAIHDNVDAEINAITNKASPVDADEIVIEDSESTWAKKKTPLSAIRNHTPASHTHLEADITDLNHNDTDAIHDNVAGEINAITEKVSPANADLLLIEDSASANAKKKVQIGNLPAGGGGLTTKSGTATTSGGSVAVSFTTAFPDNNYAVVVVAEKGSDSNIANVQSKSASGFTIITENDKGVSVNCVCWWIAIEYNDP